VAEPEPGDVGCTQIVGDVGRLIRLGEILNGSGFANIEHAFTYVGNGQIVEAEPGGARVADLTEYDARTVVWVRCPDQYRQAVAQAALYLVGTPYGFWDYAALAAHRFRLPIPGLAKFVNGTSSMICSQLAVVAARRGGWDLLEPTPAGYITPAGLAKLAAPAD
jgi:hypothetical protein